MRVIWTIPNPHSTFCPKIFSDCGTVFLMELDEAEIFESLDRVYTQDQDQLNISELLPGVYYLRSGETIQRFIKE